MNAGHPPIYDDNYHRQNATHTQNKLPVVHSGGYNYPPPANDYHPAYDVQQNIVRNTIDMELPLPNIPSHGLSFSHNYGDDNRYVEHVYESPKFEHGDADDLPQYPHVTKGEHTITNNKQVAPPHVTQYYELDPEVLPSSVATQQLS